jgi:hypothetical protein
MKGYIDANKTILSQKMLANDKDFDDLVNNLTGVLDEFIEFCETNEFRGPEHLDMRYVESGSYDNPETTIEKIKTFFSEITIKGVSYSTYMDIEKQKRLQEKAEEKEREKQEKRVKKAEETIKRGKETRRYLFDKIRGIAFGTKKKSEPKRSLTRKKDKIILPKSSKGSKGNKGKTKRNNRKK